MSLQTRINGFTAWTNLRLVPYDTLLNNVLLDLIKESHIQELLHSLTGKSLKKLQSFEGLTQPQKVVRIEWFVEELKKSEILQDDVKIEARMVCMKSADHVFDLLWRLVAHDIWFTWERMEFLQLNDEKLLSEIPFKWTPEPPPRKRKKRRVRRDAESAMSGFGAQPAGEVSPEPREDEGYDKFPGSDRMKATKINRPRGGLYSYPPPDDCILEMINSQLQKVSEGHKFTVYSLDDLVDSRALCGIINSFLPGTFTTEVMLNDRWTINLALSTVGKMLHASNPMGAEDLSEADPKSVCAYLCFLFMSCFKYKQSIAVISRLKELTLLIQETDAEISKFPETIDSMQELKAKKAVEAKLEEHQKEQETLQESYDIEYIDEWISHIKSVQVETRKIIAVKMEERFDLVTVPRNMTINELCMAIAINLQLTQGSGFYRAHERETCTPDRRIVLRVKKNKKFLDDFTGSECGKDIRELLGLEKNQVAILEPQNFPQYEIYVESMSRNKTLKTGSTFLYQVFPGNTARWQRLFFKAVRDGDLDVVKKMVTFFSVSHPHFISSQELNSGNTVLHTAARFGHFDICKFLLESGCKVNSRNKVGWTALFFAGESLHKNVAQLLIEWGCNVKTQNFKCQNAFDLIRHEEMKESLHDIGQLWASTVPLVVKGSLSSIKRIVKDHMLGIREMVDPSARCIKGSTLLHTAVYFNDHDIIKKLLKIRVDVNLKDYQGASPIHRARNLETLELLLDSNAEINSQDKEGNTALHIRCYGETGKPSFLDGIQILLSRGIDITHRNSNQLMAIHCAAMQGRMDIIELILNNTDDDLIKAQISGENNDKPPSMTCLAISQNYLDCAAWLIDQGFLFKKGEADEVLFKVLTQELSPEDLGKTSKFLLQNGASVNFKYSDGDTCLHLATALVGDTEVVENLIQTGAKVDAVNNNGSSALFRAMQLNNFKGASILIETGADVRLKNDQGLTALDLIHDFEEWISCSYFSHDIIARFKAYKLKHSRDLVRAITKKLHEDTKKNQLFSKLNNGLALNFNSLNINAPIGKPPNVKALTQSMHMWTNKNHTTTLTRQITSITLPAIPNHASLTNPKSIGF